MHLVEIELDALRESANVAAAHAADAIGRLTGLNVWMSPPIVRWTPGPWSTDLTTNGESSVIVAAALRGALSGSMICIAPVSTALALADLLLQRSGSSDPGDPLLRSCFVEVANIAGGSYLSALSRLTASAYRVSAPRFACGIPELIWHEIRDSGEWPAAGLGVETSLSVGVQGRELPIRFLLLGDCGAFTRMLSDLKAWS